MSDYGADIRRFFARASREEASKATRAVSLRVLSGVVQRTPVDTGRARGNWQVSLGQAVNGTTVDVEDQAGGATIAKGAATIGQQKGFQPVVLENNLPYINKLEDGSSKQAPNGMVSETLASMGLSPGRSSD